MVAVVSRKLAELYFPGEDPVGHRIQMDASRSSHEPWVRIVGVCGDAAFQWVDQTPRAAMYLDVAQAPPQHVHYAVMGSGNVTALAGPIRKVLAGLDAGLPVDLVQTYDQYVHDTTLGLMYAAVMLAIDAGIALLLAAIGIFGVMANLVAERRREIGVRLALGARQEDVLAMILRRAAALAGTGLAVGLLLAVALARGLAMLLYGVKPGDPAVYAGVIGAIAVAALVASWVPARRAAGVDPMQALRDE
jgi:putative ABC transport system permease protein